jgi:arabinose-5-phosphate isomerase
VAADAPMSEAVREMSGKGLGMTCVVSSASLLAGIVTDGDLRRLLQKGADILSRKASECMTPDPMTIPSDEPAAKALQVMESRKITSLVVVDSEKRVEGVIHIHDLWRTQLF